MNKNRVSGINHAGTTAMSTKIYTKTGDKGTTSLIGGTKVPKSHLRIEAYGSIDELNSYLGLCRDILEDDQTRKIILEIQDRLFTIGSSLACDPIKEPKMRIPDLKEQDITVLENEIDRMNDLLPPMKSFILPGGHPVVSHLHIARCVCRRSERACVRLELESLEVEPLILQYLNRLSDYLFMLARYAAQLLKVEELPWKARI
ncbi:MAG TPA: cob(I)yrinic acid a,c-diamide adenosyltransferase [Chitinophagaceae bacterium]|nr:cob(I)yrinic acid a,c-diamide adenosyltransferase [Chitinophagaceae bacterium]